MSHAVLALVGPSESGKTLVAEALIRRLTERGYRVAAVKHCPHGYRLDAAGSDSDRLMMAGAARVALASQTEWALLGRTDGDTHLESIAEMVGAHCDLVLGEGFRFSTVPKVLVSPETPDPAWELPEGIVAVVADNNLSGDVWQCGFDEMERLAQFVCEQFLASRHAETQVSLVVDGRAVPLNAFASSLIANTLRGLVKSFKGVPAEPSCLLLELHEKPGP